MATAKGVVSPWNAFKRLRISPSAAPAPLPRPQVVSISTSRRHLQEQAVEQDEPTDITIKNKIRDELFDIAKSRNIPLPPSLDPNPNIDLRLPRSIQTLYFQPPRRQPTHNIPVASLQLRSFSARNLEFVADLAVRAAYYLNLPAKGPVPLPRITQRWTVPRGSFVHKKSQENWERVTMRRVVQVVDGDVEAVQRWLAFVRKWCWYGVGMKANVWEWEGVEEGRALREEAVKEGLERGRWEWFGRRRGLEGEREVAEFLDRQGFAGGGGDIDTAGVHGESKMER